MRSTKKNTSPEREERARISAAEAANRNALYEQLGGSVAVPGAEGLFTVTLTADVDEHGAWKENERNVRYISTGADGAFKQLPIYVNREFLTQMFGDEENFPLALCLSVSIPARMVQQEGAQEVRQVKHRRPRTLVHNLTHADVDAEAAQHGIATRLPESAPKRGTTRTTGTLAASPGVDVKNENPVPRTRVAPKPRTAEPTPPPALLVEPAEVAVDFEAAGLPAEPRAWKANSGRARQAINAVAEQVATQGIAPAAARALAAQTLTEYGFIAQ